jgi:hypothetical protein
VLGVTLCVMFDDTIQLCDSMDMLLIDILQPQWFFEPRCIYDFMICSLNKLDVLKL